MSMMGSSGVGGPNPLESLVAMRGAMAQGPIGPGQDLASGDLSNAGGGNMPVGDAQDLLDLFSGMAQSGDDDKLTHHLRNLQHLYPELRVASHKNGTAELVGPAQEQFLGAAYARAHGAATAHVRNRGNGQRLHLAWD